VTFILDIGIGYQLRPHVDIGYRNFPKFSYRCDTSKKFSITQWSKPDDDSAFLPENSLVDSTGIAVLDTNLREMCNILSSQSCTARLWMQYLCNIEIMKAFLAAERTSKQEMHLDGMFATQEFDQLWAGLSPDLVIKHEMMIEIKGHGGLTLGRRMIETHSFSARQ